MTTETKPCVCGKLMILKEVQAVRILSSSRRYPCIWWCGGCGNRLSSEPLRERPRPDTDMYAWEEANRAVKEIGDS